MSMPNPPPSMACTSALRLILHAVTLCVKAVPLESRPDTCTARSRCARCSCPLYHKLLWNGGGADPMDFQLAIDLRGADGCGGFGRFAGLRWPGPHFYSRLKLYAYLPDSLTIFTSVIFM